MNTIPQNTVVVGFDGSPSSIAALDWAIDEARRRSLPLHLVHAYGIDYSIAAALINTPEVPAVPEVTDDLLDAAVARVLGVDPTLEVTAEATPRSVSAALVDLSGQADTIVVGGRGRGPVRSALLGSVSTQVAAHARCAVVVVHGAPEEQQRGSRVVVGVDGSQVSMPAIAYAFAQASSRGLPLTVVHTWWVDVVDGMRMTTPPASEGSTVTEGQRMLVAESLAGWREKYPNVAVTEEVFQAHAHEVLAAESEGAALVVVGSRGHGGFSGLLLGSVSLRVLQHARCPVAVVRTHPDDHR